MGLPTLLELKGLTKHFGGLAAVNQFDLYVKQGEIVGLIGPNGAGKTTVFNLITGVYPPTRGQVIYNRGDITGKKPHKVAELGIGWTLQLNPLFGDFTVLENVSASFHLQPRSSLLDIYFNTATYRRNEAYILEQSLEILRLVGLKHMKGELARNLPHGYQKMLGVARALATRPKLLLLDEPLAGMNPAEIEFTLKNIRKTKEQGVTILIVEHNMQILELCDRVVVIGFGQKICEGLPGEVRENKDVITAYLGGGHVA
ncbi:MAG: ABC transporter ATP-binding protein [Thermodesulfobacteriota bacterium]|jgi:branched-chain amino acid transport system ATP-binding protein